MYILKSCEIKILMFVLFIYYNWFVRLLSYVFYIWVNYFIERYEIFVGSNYVDLCDFFKFIFIKEYYIIIVWL